MTTIRYNNFLGLINNGVSDFLMRENELSAAKNVWSYKLGKLQKVPGYSQIGNQITAHRDISFLHYYYDTENKIDYMLAVSSDDDDLILKYRTTGDFSTINGIGTSWEGYASAKVDMTNFLGRTFIVGYMDGSLFLPNATVNGTTFSTSDTDISSMPQGKFVIVYNDLLYVLYAKKGTTIYPSRAYYSDEISSGNISWNNLSTKFISFGYDNGDEITGVAVALNRLIVFKNFSMWSYDESSVSKIADIGCNSYRSIKVINGILYWTNRKGIWRWTGSAPELISGKVQPFFDAISQSTVKNQIAEVYDENEYRVFIGDITVDNIAYTNTWICFNTLQNNFYIRCTYDKATSACVYVESNTDKKRTYFGNDNGHVMKFAHEVDSVYSDNEHAIDSFFTTKAYDHGVPEDLKFTNRIVFFTNYAVGMKCAVEKNNSGIFKESYAIINNNNISEARINVSSNRTRYKFYEKGKGKSWEFEGFAISTDIKENWE